MPYLLKNVRKVSEIRFIFDCGSNFRVIGLKLEVCMPIPESTTNEAIFTVNSDLIKDQAKMQNNSLTYGRPTPMIDIG